MVMVMVMVMIENWLAGGVKLDRLRGRRSGVWCLYQACEATCSECLPYRTSEICCFILSYSIAILILPRCQDFHLSNRP